MKIEITKGRTNDEVTKELLKCNYEELFFSFLLLKRLLPFQGNEITFSIEVTLHKNGGL